MASLGRLELKPPEDLEVGIKRLSTYEDALAAVVAKGIMQPQVAPASFQGEIHGDITLLDDKALGTLLGQLSEYLGYVEVELAKAEAKSREAEAILEFTCATVRSCLQPKTSTPGGKLHSKDKDDLVTTHPDVVEAKSRDLYAETIFRLTKTVFNKATKNWETVSRRITQRGQDLERAKRGENIGAIPSIPGHSFRR
jgi:hypothetical protein